MRAVVRIILVNMYLRVIIYGLNSLSDVHCTAHYAFFYDFIDSNLNRKCQLIMD